MAGGKAVYWENPTGTTTAEALALYHEAQKAGVKHGVVHDKLWLMGIRKLHYLIDSGFFGRILSVRGKFGYWVFDTYYQPCQRPSWNYRKEDGGGITLELFLRHVASDDPFPWDLLEGAKGVHLAEKATQSWLERRWVDLEPLW